VDTVIPWRRSEHLERIDKDFDLVVIGGGIVGAGIALDAAHRGKRVCIVERDDWASGTSSRSTKLLHGGVRYLPQLRFGLIRRGLKEQRVLGEIADYLVEPIDFVIPVYRDRGFADAPAWARHPRIFPIAIRLGLWWYDRLGVHADKTKRIRDVEELKALFPRLKTDGLRHGVVYRDAQTNDARLTLMVVRTAVDLGAVAVSHTEATDIRRDGDHWVVDVADRLGGETKTIRSRAIASATGAEPPPGEHGDELPIVFSKGAHINVRESDVGVTDAALVLPETSDRRVLFLVPWRGHVVVGTTDTPYEGDLIHPRADQEDIRYLTAELESYLDLDDFEPLSAWAGLRALVGSSGGSTSKASREHRVLEVAPDYVQVAGGKLTGYRHIAEEVADRVWSKKSRSRKGTAEVAIHGSGADADLVEKIEWELTSLGAPVELAAGLVGRYGDAARLVLDIAHDDTALARTLADRWLAAEVPYAARHESAATITDFVQRRTRLAWFTPDHGRGVLGEIGELLAEELGWEHGRLGWELQRTEADLAAEGL